MIFNALFGRNKRKNKRSKKAIALATSFFIGGGRFMFTPIAARKRRTLIRNGGCCGLRRAFFDFGIIFFSRCVFSLARKARFGFEGNWNTLEFEIC